MGGKKSITSARMYRKTIERAKEDARKTKISNINETKPLRHGKYYFPPVPFRNSDPPQKHDFLKKNGAVYLAYYLQDYWRFLGYRKACFWAEKETNERYTIRSNLVNGIPPI